MVDINVEEIARKFSEYLVLALAKEEIHVINRLNDSVQYEGNCASLFFTEAQTLMLRAFENSTGRHWDAQSNADFIAINTAWQWAKEQGFFQE